MFRGCAVYHQESGEFAVAKGERGVENEVESGTLLALHHQVSKAVSATASLMRTLISANPYRFDSQAEKAALVSDMKLAVELAFSDRLTVFEGPGSSSSSAAQPAPTSDPPAERCTEAAKEDSDSDGESGRKKRFKKRGKKGKR